MIEEYFKNQQESLLIDKHSLEKDYTRINNQITETEKFIDLLEEKSDPNFESFTPREVNVKNRTEIKGLKEEKKRLQKEKSNLIVRIDECNSRIEEFESFLHCVKEKQIKFEEDKKCREEQAIDNLEILNYVSREKEKRSVVMSESILNPILDMNQKIKRIIQFFDMDRERAKLELQQLNVGMSMFENNVRTMIDQDTTEIGNGSIEKYLTKVIEYYSQENNCELHVKFDIDENIIDYELPVHRTICKLLKKILEDVISRSCNICVAITSSESMNKFLISMELLNLETSVEIESVLINDRDISIYAYLLSILIDYKHDESGNFIISFEY